MAQDKVEKQQQTKGVQTKNGRGGFQQAPQQAHAEPPMSTPQTRVGQARMAKVLQRKVGNGRTAQHFNQTPIQRKENKTGLPDRLKSGVESLSGYSMDDVKVHYNSSKPAQVQAHAYTQGTDIHVAHGQQKHVAHEAWHVVQQKQGRVKPTIQRKGIQINDDSALEQEADHFGELSQTFISINDPPQFQSQNNIHSHSFLPIQRKLSINGKHINDSSYDGKVFGQEAFQTTLSFFASQLNTSLPKIKQGIQNMIVHPFTHVFKGRNPDQYNALIFILKLPKLPTNYSELQAVASQPQAQSYSLFSTVRHDRVLGLATVDELGLNRRDGEADLSGFKTQVVDPNSLSGVDVDAKLKEADESLIARGVQSRSVETDPSKVGASKGLGDATKHWRTVVHWNSAISNEGTHMRAYPLGPDHTLGSTPGSDTSKTEKPWNKARRRMEKLTKDKVSYVAGHLLNEQLGGPGDDVRNLAPISSEANSKHKNEVENHLKKMVNKEYQWVFYEVKTERSNLDGSKSPLISPTLYDQATWGDGKFTSKFICTWGNINAKGQKVNEKQVTLVFSDPTSLVTAVPLAGDTTKNDDFDRNILQFGLDTQIAKSEFDPQRVVLNTILKVKSYLIAAQGILPGLQALKQEAKGKDTQINQLVDAISAYNANSAFLDDVPKVRDEAEEFVDALNKAVENPDEMRAIYRTNINKIPPYSGLVKHLRHTILLKMEEPKERAIKLIDATKNNYLSDAKMTKALDAVKLLIIVNKHPVVTAIESVIHAFTREHDAFLKEYYRAEQQYAEELEDELDDKDKEINKLESENAWLQSALQDKDEEVSRKDNEIARLKLIIFQQSRRLPPQRDESGLSLLRSLSQDEIGRSSLIPLSPRERQNEEEGQKKIAVKRSRDGGQDSDIGQITQPSIEKGKKKIRQQLVPKEAGDVVIDPPILANAENHIFVHSNQIESFLNQDSARQFNSDQNKGSYYFRKDGTRYKCVEFDHQNSLWKFVKS